jgi:hypothetical protein
MTSLPKLVSNRQIVASLALMPVPGEVWSPASQWFSKATLTMTISSKDPLSELKRLRQALEAVSADLAAEGLAAEGLEPDEAQRLESFVHHFAFAIKRNCLTQP